MRRVIIKGVLAYKLRLALTALAIVLGVTFISGTFVLTDTLNSAFSELFGNVYQNMDFQVRGAAQFGKGADAVRNPMSASVLAAVRQVPGVRAAYGQVEGYAQFVSRDGKAIVTGGEPTVGTAFGPSEKVTGLHLIAGRAPRTATDVVMDNGTARKYGFAVGQRVQILFGGPPKRFTITGIAQFGTANNLAGETLAAFTLPTAQRVLGEIGQLNTIDVVAAPGASKGAVQRAIAAKLPRGVEVVTGQAVASEKTEAVGKALSFFSTALLVFALISLFVGAFTIFNTFSIIVGQRTRELALLRLVGASRRQLFRSVLGEAAIVGAVSSLIGVGLGMLAALGLEALLGGLGITLPGRSLVFEPRTAAVALAVGVGVTVISAIGPARRAVRVPPVAAITDRPLASEALSPRRLAWGIAGAVAGAAMLGTGLARPDIRIVALGVVWLFVNAAVLAPAVARPLSSAIGRPIARILGVAGRLGRQNSMRSPKRTAQTAAALMVGLAVVCAMSVFGASLSRSATSSVQGAISADMIITAGNAGLSAVVPAQASAVPGVTSSSTLYQGQFAVGGTLQSLSGVTTPRLARTVILNMTAGSSAALARGSMLIDSATATAKHLSVGDVIRVKFAKTGLSDVHIGGIYKPNTLIGSYLASAGFYLEHFAAGQRPAAVLLRIAGSATQHVINRTMARYPGVQVQTRAQYEQTQAASVNQVLGLVYVLLALAIIIALIGVVNTLMLSVFERTREIGLLRAVGMQRRQARTMVASESVILAVFGGILGIVIGVGLGLALVMSLRHDGITSTVVPAANLLAFMVLSALLGLLAAVWPARRAARLDLLAAIATR